MPAEAKVGLSSFNEAIDGLNVKLDSYFARLEGKLEDAITSIKDTVIKRLQEDNNALRQRLREVERKLENNLQYQRRNNIIIDGLPANIPANQLENRSLQLFASIGVDMVLGDIEACHPLPAKKGLAPVIVKVVNRKHAELAIKNRSKLKDSDKSFLGSNFHGNLFINNHLTPYFSHLAWRCRILKKKGLIRASSISNETVKIKINDGDGFVRILDGSHLDDVFPIEE